MPRLRILAGPSPDSLFPILPNNNVAYPIKSNVFEGKVIAHIKGFPDEDGNVLSSEYFERDDRRDTTWSIQVQGRFLRKYSADDILFGNTFDRPLKLPWGTSAALKFMHFIDPTLEHDLTSSSFPWALSPLISTMPYFVHTPLPMSPPKFPSTRSIVDDVSNLRLGGGNGRSPSSSISSLESVSSSGSGSSSSSRMSKWRKMGSSNAGRGESIQKGDSKRRRAYFSEKTKRKQITFGPDDILTTDFCYNFISFPSLSLTLPCGLAFDLTKYWDGQPVRFVCCERPIEGDNVSSTTVFWCVAIERLD